ncbi:hypothetical protein [Ramlibacter sp. AN1133]|uniref:hypothetical protein n=1 Tax=Ramlibacter sp. AN1133 TaxID=3133429 RepID=UPI0030BF5723
MSSPVNLSSLCRLADEGFNAGVLALIEHRVLSQAIALREMKGFTAHPAIEVRQLAESLLPVGEQLYLLYTQTKAGMARGPVQDLEAVSRNLALCAERLEATAVRSIVATQGRPLADRARAEQALGERYARLLEAARELESSGVIPVTLEFDLANLGRQPTGPLSPFYDKAVAILAERQSKAPRMRAAA